MKVLITGGAGFIGSNVIRFLNKNHPDWELLALDDLSTGSRSNLEGLDARFVDGSILDFATVQGCARDVDSIIHLAAIPSVPRSIADPVPTHLANVTGTMNVLEAARLGGTEQVIFASSSSVYGSNPALPKSERDWTRPMSPYGASKLAAEAYVLSYAFSYGMKSLAFRFFNVYGPGQSADHAYAAVVPKFVDRALEGEPLVVYGDGSQTRDFTYVDSVCAVLAEAVDRRVSSHDPVNLAFGTRTSLLELIDDIRPLVSHDVEVRHSDARAGDVRDSQADGIVLRQMFPSIQPTGLADGLRETIDWLRSRKG